MKLILQTGMVFLCFLLFFNGIPSSLYAGTPDTTRPRIVTVDYSDLLSGTMIDGSMRRVLTGNVRLSQDEVKMYADRATIFRNNVDAAGNIVIVQNDSLSVYSDSLIYTGNTRKARLFRNVVLVDAEKQLFTELLNYDLNDRVGTYNTGALLTDQETQLTSIKGRYLVGPGIAYFTDSVVLRHPDFTLWTDSLDYYSEEQRADFRGATVIKQDSAIISSMGGYYLMDHKYAYFDGGVTMQQGEDRAVSNVLRYDGRNDLIWLEGDAEVWDKGRHIQADTILYNRVTDQYTTLGRSAIYEGSRIIYAQESFYDARAEKSSLFGQVVIIDESYYLEADTVYYFNQADSGIAYGNVFWSDTLEGVFLTAGFVSFNRGGANFKAAGNPILSYVTDGDTMHIAADTIYSEEMPEMDSLKLVRAFHQCLVYKSDVQAKADSLVYTEWDSIFAFFGEPVVWADSAQFSADTIRLYSADGELRQMHQSGSSFILHFPDVFFANQIRGRTIETLFEDGKADRMLVDGNAQVIYFPKDDFGAFIGVNHADCSRMRIEFLDNQIDQIVFIEQTTGTMFPMTDQKAISDRLEHFKDERLFRPKSKADLQPENRLKVFQKDQL